MHRVKKSIGIMVCFVTMVLLITLSMTNAYADYDDYYNKYYNDDDNYDDYDDYDFDSEDTVVYTNEDNGYVVIIDDEAELLSDYEKRKLRSEMINITVYGNVAFKTIDSNYTSTEDYIEEYYHNTFGTDSGTVFLIDMDNRNIWIFSDGDIYKTITNSYADTITDNVYTYASDSEYYKCASKAFSQIHTLLRGKKIAQPMKYISNAFLAVITALILNYFIVKKASASKQTKTEELLRGMQYHCHVYDPCPRFTHQTRKYSPQSSGSSGGGGGGGGGGSSGGGGGHSF